MGQLETKNRYHEAHMPVLPKALEFGGLQWAFGSLRGPRGRLGTREETGRTCTWLGGPQRQPKDHEMRVRGP